MLGTNVGTPVSFCLRQLYVLSCLFTNPQTITGRKGPPGQRSLRGRVSRALTDLRGRRCCVDKEEAPGERDGDGVGMPVLWYVSLILLVCRITSSPLVLVDTRLSLTPPWLQPLGRGGHMSQGFGRILGEERKTRGWSEEGVFLGRPGRVSFVSSRLVKLPIPSYIA